MTTLILASASLGRKYLLDKLKLNYETIHTNLNEEKIIADNPINTILLRARLKGEYVRDLLISSFKSPKLLKSLKFPTTYNLKPTTFLILSADTEVILNNQLFGKPASEKEAVKMLQTLSGKTHEVVTGIYIIIISNFQFPISNKIQNLNFQNKIMNAKIPILKTLDHDVSRVTFRKLTDSDIKRYLKYTDYTRFTGGYALVASPQDFVTKVEGSISNVIGLPMEKIIPILQKNKLLK